MPNPPLHSLFERLAGGALAARCSVVTPTRRLARALARQFDAWQLARGRTVWESAPIIPYPTFVAQLYEVAQHDPALTGIRAPISAAQERTLWEDVIGSSDIALASTAGAAQLAAEAWLLAHQWQLAGRLRAYSFTEDTRVFGTWRAQYVQRVEDIGAIDQARLPDEVRALLSDGRLRPTMDLVLAGFDETTPQQRALFAALIERGARCETLEFEMRTGRCARAPAADGRDEVARMSDWVAARLAANPASRIGIVVPELAARRRTLTRALDAALEPDAILAPGDRLRPYTVSLGAPLADAPLVAAALRLFRLLAGEIEFEDASALIRSRYMKFGPAADVERFDLDWRERSGRLTSLERMLAATVRDQKHVHPVPRATLQSLLGWREKHRRGTRRLSEWAALLTAALRLAGFPGGTTLDSHEYQTLARWRDLLTEFAALERVQGPVTLSGAVTRLARLAGSTVFQPEGGDPPVQVLGLLEARGLEFDHLWIAGLTADAWPPTVRPHPLLPFELQRAEGMPGADPARDLARARASLERLARSAPEVIASHALREGDREVAASSMISAWPTWTAAAFTPRAVDAIAPAPLETLAGEDAPPLDDARTGAVAGGTALLTDQAACPFRAFGNHRLKATEPAATHEGLDASERGQLVHGVLALFWEDLPERTRAFAAGMSDRARLAALERAADLAIASMQEQRLGALGAAMTSLEKRRLVELAGNWLQYEFDQRLDFEVVAREEWRVMAVGPLSLRGRLDRVDRLPDGRTVVIDYKTGGGANVRSWLGSRPAEPQLPMYLVATQPDACAVAFARVRTGEQRFIALAEDESLLPGAKTDWKEHHADWTALVASWSVEMTRLAQEFAAGQAAVDPVRGAQTCRYCGLAPVCRLNERMDEAQLEAEQPDER